MSAQPAIRFSTTDSYVPKTYSPPAFNSGTYEQAYQPAYVSTGYPVDNRTTTFVGAPDGRNTYSGAPVGAPKISFGHQGGAYVAPTSVYQQPRETTVVTGSSVPAGQFQPQPATYARESEVRQNQGHAVRAPAPSGLKQDDDFLCGKAGWIICGIISLILIALILLFGLGAFGGSGNNTSAAVTGPTATTNPSTDTPTTPTTPASSGPGLTTATGTTSVSPSPSGGSSAVTPGSVAPVSVQPVPATNANSIPAQAV